MYSRTSRVALVLAIAMPLIGIGAVLLYVDSLSPATDSMIVEAAPTNVTTSEVAQAPTPTEPQEEASDANPLQPIGPKASTRVTSPVSGSCSSGGCTTPSTPRSGCSSGSSCGG
ncbi:hypothetical protein ACFLUT_00435 [Chloroflexota bacterium]